MATATMPMARMCDFFIVKILCKNKTQNWAAKLPPVISFDDFYLVGYLNFDAHLKN